MLLVINPTASLPFSRISRALTYPKGTDVLLKHHWSLFCETEVKTIKKNMTMQPYVTEICLKERYMKSMI